MTSKCTCEAGTGRGKPTKTRISNIMDTALSFIPSFTGPDSQWSCVAGRFRACMGRPRILITMDRLGFVVVLFLASVSIYSVHGFPSLLLGGQSLGAVDRRLLQGLLLRDGDQLRGGSSSLREYQVQAISHRSCSTARYAGTSAKFRNFEEMLIAYQDTPVLVSFHARFCGPCRLVKKELAVVSDDLGDTVKVFAVDTEKWPKLGARYSVQGLPCIVVFLGGKVLEKIEGVEKADEIIRRVKMYLTKEKDG